MAAMEPLYKLLLNNTKQLDGKRIEIVEIFLLMKLFTYLEEKTQEEEFMQSENLIKKLIRNLVLTGEYSIEGIAYEVQQPVDVIYEIASGQNNNPSFQIARGIFELHKNRFPDFYKEILSNILPSSSEAGQL